MNLPNADGVQSSPIVLRHRVNKASHHPKAYIWRQAFIEAYRIVPDIAFASQAAGVKYASAKRALTRDPAFREALEAAFQEAKGRLVRKAVELAMGGSERMLIKLLESWDPEQFSPQVRGRLDGRMEHAFVSLQAELEAGTERGMRLLPPAEEA